MIRAETRDDEAAKNLRDVVNGFMALAKLQADSKPEVQAMLQSLALGGTGRTVALSFTVPAEVFDIIGAREQSGTAQRPLTSPFVSSSEASRLTPSASRLYTS